MTIDEIFIKNIINSYENLNIPEDEFTDIENVNLLEAIEHTINSIISLGEENSIMLYKEKINKEIPIIRIDKNIVGSSLFFSLFISIYDFILRKYYKENQYNYVISNLLKYAIKIYQDILSFIQTKSVDGILSRIRTIYETWVIQEFIVKNQELASNFLEHKRIVAIKLNEEMRKKLNKKEQKIKTDLLKKFGADFANEYGWVSSVIKNARKRNPQGLVNYLNLDSINSFSYIYKIACQFVHTTSLGIFSNEDENVEMIDVFNHTASQIIVNMFIKFMEELQVNNKDKNILLAILIGTIEEVKDM
jgi:hypothetical protein